MMSQVDRLKAAYEAQLSKQTKRQEQLQLQKSKKGSKVSTSDKPIDSMPSLGILKKSKAIEPNQPHSTRL